MVPLQGHSLDGPATRVRSGDSRAHRNGCASFAATLRLTARRTDRDTSAARTCRRVGRPVRAARGECARRVFSETAGRAGSRRCTPPLAAHDRRHAVDVERREHDEHAPARALPRLRLGDAAVERGRACRASSRSPRIAELQREAQLPGGARPAGEPIVDVPVEVIAGRVVHECRRIRLRRARR